MEPLRDLLRSALANSLSSLPAIERAAAAWPVAAGHAIAQHSAVLALEGTSVTIQVDGAAWLQQLRNMAPRLQKELANVAGIPLTAIHFQQKP